MAIFHHQDGDEPNVDYVEILAPEGRNVLRIMCQSPGDGLGDVSTSCTLDRDAVLHLHAALGEWLYPVHTPEGPNRSLIEQMIDKAVRDQVAAVLPLHLAPVACVHMGHCRDANGVQVIQCPEPDPEPGDVGHPRPAGPCGEAPPVGFNVGHVHTCGYVWGAHRPQETEPEHGRLMANLPRRIRQLPEPGCVCGHGWMEHYSSMCWGGEEKYGCRCTQVRPAPVPVPEYCGECEHSWARHGVGAGPCNVRVPGGECGCERLRP